MNPPPAERRPWGPLFGWTAPSPSVRADLYDFFGFPGTFARTLATNEVTTLEAPGGHRILAFVGGRDDAFFHDLPGFFRSINYGPQFYEAPRAQAEAWPTTEEFLGRFPYLAAPC